LARATWHTQPVPRCAQGSGEGGAALESCRYLHGRGVDFDRINTNGQGCLHKAAQRGNTELCQWLVHTLRVGEHHFKPNAAEESTPAQLAHYSGHKELAAWLRELEQGKQATVACGSTEC
jgi:hypothetical protein